MTNEKNCNVTVELRGDDLKDIDLDEIKNRIAQEIVKKLQGEADEARGFSKTYAKSHERYTLV
ncbi:hypothetical protein [Paenibacillus ehimensis]|uniref:hypothetical protein n=1 Tax=Paenibacillus ehimensis TaxID=79264 RepID=UPI0004719740|nr:hypothetical protein [Paenibacillus ehimensis]